jgi:leucyl/phenylalanyl-tRNA---protein transferase
MPIYRLDPRIPLFPPPEEAEEDGLLAVGGDLSVPRLLEAYRNGIFPWFEPGEEPLWWCPSPRLILEPGRVVVSRSLRATIRKGRFAVRVDTAFRDVIHACAAIKRVHEDGTWISSDIQRSYSKLFDLGYAHSFETWRDGKLVGGLYGVCIGRAFFGESMFAKETDASKVAVVALGEECTRRQIAFIDCQITSAHLISLGAFEVSRSEFLSHLRAAVKHPDPPGRWTITKPRAAAP